jgi:hypothetical protein
MVCFMTYPIYSLNFSSLFPQQSEYLMMITLYFLLSIFWTLISMAWFLICNHYTTKAQMPKKLCDFCGQLQRMYCCCFPQPKNDKKKDIIVENGECRNFDNQESTTATSTGNMKCFFARIYLRHVLKSVIKLKALTRSSILSLKISKLAKQIHPMFSHLKQQHV